MRGDLVKHRVLILLFLSREPKLLHAMSWTVLGVRITEEQIQEQICQIKLRKNVKVCR